LVTSSDGVVAAAFPFLSDDLIGATGAVCRFAETFAALSSTFRDFTLYTALFGREEPGGTRPLFFLLELGAPLKCTGTLAALRGGEVGVKVDLEEGAERDDFAGSRCSSDLPRVH